MNTLQRIGRLLLIAALASVLPSTVACSKGQKRPPAPPASPVNVAQVLAKDVPDSINTVGQVQAYSTVSVKAQVGGEIVSVNFQEGQNVKKNEVLFVIDPRPFEVALKQAEAQLEKDRALLRNAEADLARYENLVRKDYVTKEQYDSLAANRDVLAAAIKSDEAGIVNARLQLEYCTVTSPIDGRTGSLLIHQGNIIKANDLPALTILQDSPIYVVFSVTQQYLPQIKEYMAKGDIRTEVFPSGEGGPAVAGVLSFVDNTIDTTTGSIMLKSTFPNADRTLWPGQFLNVSLILFTEKNAVVVPSQAVQTGQAGQYVMVVKSDMTVESRTVEVDRTYGNLSVIRSGLKPGETVVTDGLLRLVPGARVEIQKTAQETP